MRVKEEKKTQQLFSDIIFHPKRKMEQRKKNNTVINVEVNNSNNKLINKVFVELNGFITFCLTLLVCLAEK